MSRQQLVTGATGFVGGALVLELLARTDDQIVCLVRSGKSPGAGQARLQSSLLSAAAAYGRLDLTGEIEGRCRALPGDITLADCGGAFPDGLRVSEVWHCAASLNYEEKNEEQIVLHNVQGTKNVLALAERLGASVFDYVSTAYVAGRRGGLILEEPAQEPAVTNNCYEKSKVAAEALVAGKEPFHVRVLRPSIVIGHSRTLVATSFTGLYGFMRELHRFKRVVSGRLGEFLRLRSLRLRAEAEVPLNFIPVDGLAANAVGISLSNTPERYFHLTNRSSVSVGDGMLLLFRLLQLRAPRFATSPREFTSLDEALDRELEFYNSYLSHAKVFDQTHTDAILGPAASSWPLPTDRLSAFLEWYLDCLEGSASGIAEPPPGPRGVPAAAGLRP